MHPKHENGLVYVATVRNRYVEEAFISADSVKQHCPHLNITLFTDKPDHHLCSKGVFNEVRTVTRAFSVRTPWGEGQINRIRALMQTPYAYTLHLDTDTRIRTAELESIFEALDRAEIGMVEDPERFSYCRSLLHKPMFNGGLVLYRKNDRVMELLSAWLALAEQHAQFGAMANLPHIPILDVVENEMDRRKLLFNDQTALVQLFSPEVNKFDLKYEVLDYCWNARKLHGPETGGRPVRILHYHLFDMHAPALELALQRVVAQKQAPNGVAAGA